MARTIKIEILEGGMRRVRLKEKAWLSGEGTPVPDGDPSAAFLIGPAGREFTWREAVAFGLVEDPSRRPNGPRPQSRASRKKRKPTEPSNQNQGTDS